MVLLIKQSFGLFCLQGRSVSNRLCYCPLVHRSIVGDAGEGGNDNLSGKISKATPKCEMVLLYKNNDTANFDLSVL